jgi:hypothetical protein
MLQCDVRFDLPCINTSDTVTRERPPERSCGAYSKEPEHRVGCKHASRGDSASERYMQFSGRVEQERSLHAAENHRHHKQLRDEIDKEFRQKTRCCARGRYTSGGNSEWSAGT